MTRATRTAKKSHEERWAVMVRDGAADLLGDYAGVDEDTRRDIYEYNIYQNHADAHRDAGVECKVGDPQIDHCPVYCPMEFDFAPCGSEG